MGRNKPTFDISTIEIKPYSPYENSVYSTHSPSIATSSVSPATLTPRGDDNSNQKPLAASSSSSSSPSSITSHKLFLDLIGRNSSTLIALYNGDYNKPLYRCVKAKRSTISVVHAPTNATAGLIRYHRWKRPRLDYLEVAGQPGGRHLFQWKYHWRDEDFGTRSRWLCHRRTTGTSRGQHGEPAVPVAEITLDLTEDEDGVCSGSCDVFETDLMTDASRLGEMHELVVSALLAINGTSRSDANLKGGAAGGGANQHFVKRLLQEIGDIIAPSGTGRGGTH